ncbi:MAG: HAD family hydrolase [Gammaproteobacteria bacterium]|nr:MAG: HAD family hydrolase [Gammaproteobacteria bacterium]
MSELKALIFDVDGTLADTERHGHRVAFNEAFREHGLDWHWDEELYGELLAITGGKERIRHYLAGHHPEFLQRSDIDELIPELHKAKTRHYLALLAEGRIPLRPGVERLLREAMDEGLRLAIATTTTPENVTALLAATLGEDSIGWFEVIGAGDIVPAKKPAPDIYHWTLDQMGLPAEEALALEDSRNGLRAASDAGLRSLITTNGYTAQEDFDGAALVVDSLGEPGSPMRILQGELTGHEWITPAALRDLHAA